MRLSLLLLLYVVAGSAAGGAVAQVKVESVRPAPDQSVITGPEMLLPLYRQVLRQIIASSSGRERPSMVLNLRSLNAWCHPHCTDSTRVERTQPDTLIRALLEEGLITSTCSENGEAAPSCRSSRSQWVITLGIPFPLRPGFRIPPTVGERDNVTWIAGVPADTVDVSIGLDLSLSYGATPVGGHLSPAVKGYRYLFTRSGACYTAVVRMSTGET